MISVSIVTYKTDLQELSRCLQSLTSPQIARIYIVDNSNQQYIADFCKSYDKVQYIASANNGYGSGHNQAIRLALENQETTYHLVLNADVYFNPSILELLSEYMDKNTDVAQVQPNITNIDGTPQYTCRLLPTPSDLILRRFLPNRLFKRQRDKYLLKLADRTKEMNVPYHQGSFMFFRIACFKTVGLFDERFFMYPEDIDITRRMHKQYRTLYWPGVTVIHEHHAESYKNRKMLWIHIVNMVKYFNKWGWLFDRERKRWNKQLLKELGIS
jgi:hypothetical protein